MPHVGNFLSEHDSMDFYDLHNSFWNVRVLLQVWKMQPPEKGVLFGYPIFSKKPDGIMVIAETLAGGWYK